MKRTPLKRTGFLRRTGRLPAQSDSFRRVNEKRRKMLEQYKSDLCAVGDLDLPVRSAGPLDPHEPLTRARGGSITDPDNLVWICRAHHDWLHANPQDAYYYGLLKHSWEAS